MEKLPRRTDTLKEHSFFKRMEGILDRVSLPYEMNIYQPHKDDVEYPTMEKHYENASPQKIRVLESAENIYNYAAIILGTIDKLELTLSNIEKLNFREGIAENTRLFEYYIENYYLRFPIILEQVYTLLNELLNLEYDFRGPVGKFEKILEQNIPDLWEIIDTYKQNTKQLKQTRNIVAHQGNYDEDDLNKIRSWLNLTISYGALVPVNYNNKYVTQLTEQLIIPLNKYKEKFLSSAAYQMDCLINFLREVLRNIEDVATKKLLSDPR